MPASPCSAAEGAAAAAAAAAASADAAAAASSAASSLVRSASTCCEWVACSRSRRCSRACLRGRGTAGQQGRSVCTRVIWCERLSSCPSTRGGRSLQAAQLSALRAERGRQWQQARRRKRMPRRIRLLGGGCTHLRPRLGRRAALPLLLRLPLCLLQPGQLLGTGLRRRRRLRGHRPAVQSGTDVMCHRCTIAGSPPYSWLTQSSRRLGPGGSTQTLSYMYPIN